MANGLLQGDYGNLLNDVRNGTLAELQQAFVQLVMALTTPPVWTEQVQPQWQGAAGPAIWITAAANATPEAIGVQVGQGGPQAILGVGNASEGLTANCLNNRDVYQTQNADTIARFSAAANNKPYSKTATGYGTTGIATGKLSSDKGTMTAGPGELMPNAQVSGLQKVFTNNFVAIGTLVGSLTAATHWLTGATTAQLQTGIKDPAGSGNLVTTNAPILTLTNRDSTLSGPAGSLCIALSINSEWNPIWVSCAAVS